MKRLILSILACVYIFSFTSVAFAHPGRTAADGCHYCRTNCDRWGEAWDQRHCHGAPLAPAQTYTPPPVIISEPEPVVVTEPIATSKPQVTAKSETVATPVAQESLVEAIPTVEPLPIEEIVDESNSNATTPEKEESSAGSVFVVLAGGGAYYWWKKRG